MFSTKLKIRAKNLEVLVCAARGASNASRDQLRDFCKLLLHLGCYHVIFARWQQKYLREEKLANMPRPNRGHLGIVAES